MAARLAELGHSVTVGTRDPAATTARTEPDGMGNPPFATWHAEHPDVTLATFEQAARHGEIVLNATGGSGSLPALTAAGADNLRGKVPVAFGTLIGVCLVFARRFVGCGRRGWAGYSAGTAVTALALLLWPGDGGAVRTGVAVVITSAWSTAIAVDARIELSRPAPVSAALITD